MSLAKSSHSRGKHLQASLAHKCSEWHIHFCTTIPGLADINLLTTELYLPNIALHPSDANPMTFVSGI